MKDTWRPFKRPESKTATAQKRMKLLTKKLKEKIPGLYETEDIDDPTVWTKFFYPNSTWSWFVIEYDPERELAFGLVRGFETELGYFSLKELRETTDRLGLPIERDTGFKPMKLSELQAKLHKHGYAKAYAMSERSIYHITFDEDRGNWAVIKRGNENPSLTKETKQEAIKAGKKLAKNNKPSQIFIHRKSDGEIHIERTYGHDPREIHDYT